MKPRSVAERRAVKSARRAEYFRWAIAVFARTPSPGNAKTRLIPLLGSRGAAELYTALVLDTLRRVDSLKGAVSRYLFLAGSDRSAFSSSSGYRVVRQRGETLGERLEHAFRYLLRRHRLAVIIGTDSPLVSLRILRQAFYELRICDAVLGPCPDGGYYLVGLRRLSPGLLKGVRWGSVFAFRDTLRNLLGRHFACSILDPIRDVDRPEDVRALEYEMARSHATRRLAPATWRFLRALP